MCPGHDLAERRDRGALDEGRGRARYRPFVLSPLDDPAYFAQVTVDQEAGTLVWPDGIDLAPEPLYEQAKAHPLLAA